jgi:hypothetical protein
MSSSTTSTAKVADVDFEERSERARIENTKDHLARRTARLDQRKKQFEEQYPICPPDVNLWRLDYIAVRKFKIDIDRWELEGKIKDIEDEET